MRYLLCLFGIAAALSAQTVTPPLPPQGYSLLFHDEFDGQSLDTSKWLPAWPWGNGLNDTYPDDEALPRNISISKGIAHFTVTRGGTSSGASYGSAVASTAGRFSLQYGYWEARVRMPSKAHGLWPAFWLVATDGTWPPEIDIMEWLGNNPTMYDMTVHYGSTNRSDEGIFYGPDFSADYHVLGFLSTPSGLHWYVDGIERFSTMLGIPTKPLQIILNNSTGGWNGNVVDSTTVFPASFDVDYVRVYANNGLTAPPPSGGGGGGGTATDNTEPSTPTGFTGQANSRSEVGLWWDPSKDNVGVAGYQIFRNGVKVGTTADNWFDDTGLSRSTRYTYRISAFDAAGNVSRQSSAVSVTTAWR
jgi:beta-glucanase (GH16 family)